MKCLPENLLPLEATMGGSCTGRKDAGVVWDTTEYSHKDRTTDR